jgi:hypothetical protein
MRVRISFDALRLCLLVAAGVTSGYLWRAAFESSSPEEQVAASPAIVEKAPAPPVVRIVPHHLRRNPPALSTRAVRHVVVRPTRTAATGLISSHVASPPSSSPQPESPPTPPPSPPAKPTPAPTPAPAPPPRTPTSPPPQTPSPPPPPVVAAPVQQAVAPPAAPTTPTTPTTPGASGDGSRPGWGKGDDNHDHTGPGGKGK